MPFSIFCLLLFIFPRCDELKSIFCRAVHSAAVHSAGAGQRRILSTHYTQFGRFISARVIKYCTHRCPYTIIIVLIYTALAFVSKLYTVVTTLYIIYIIYLCTSGIRWCRCLSNSYNIIVCVIARYNKIYVPNTTSVDIHIGICAVSAVSVLLQWRNWRVSVGTT